MTADAAELVRALQGLSPNARRHVLVTGATGFIGRRLTEAFASAGHEVTVLTRDPAKAATLRPPFRLVTRLDQIPSDTAIDAVVNLAGEPVAGGLWTRRRRRRILASRLRMTRGIVRLIGRLQRPPAVLVSGSAIGWYGLWGDETLTEFDGGKRSFTHRVCEAWEQMARRAEKYGTRVVRLRLGLVLGTDGGMLGRLLVPFEFGLGGAFGRGEQWMSWIERDDLVRLMAHVIADKIAALYIPALRRSFVEAPSAMTILKTPMYIEGSMNDFKAVTHLESTEPRVFEATLPLKQGMNEFRILSEDGKTISFGAFIDEVVMKLDQTKDLEFEGEDFFIQIDKPGEYIVKFDAKNARKPTLVVRPLTAPTP